MEIKSGVNNPPFFVNGFYTQIELYMRSEYKNFVLFFRNLYSDSFVKNMTNVILINDTICDRIEL